MDMRIDTNKLTRLRGQRAWSQQYLADVAGVSLRTVQRIEKTGVASGESVRALASAFDVKAAELMVPLRVNRWMRKIATLGAALTGMLFVAVAVAFSLKGEETVLLAVNAQRNHQDFADVQFTGVLDTPSDYFLNDSFKLSVLPEPTSKGSVLLKTQFSSRQPGGRFVVIAEPGVLANYDQPVAVSFTDDQNNQYGFQITLRVADK